MTEKRDAFLHRARFPASMTFDEVRDDVAKVVRRVFPRAQAVRESGMDGWRIARPKGAPRPAREGTMPADFVYVLLADRKAGPTLHVWYPGDYDWLDARKDELTEAGFKVMRACLQFMRKREYPVAAVEKLLRDVKAMDAKATGRPSPSAAPRTAPSRPRAGASPPRSREGPAARGRASRAR